MSWKILPPQSEQYTCEYFLQDNVCRICWRQNACREITKTAESEMISSLFDKIIYCLDINLAQYTHINRLCGNCFNEINKFYDFKTYCREADEKLHRILQNSRDSKKELCTGVKVEESELSNLELKIDSVDEFFEDGICQLVPETKTKKVKIKKKHKGPNSLTYCHVCCFELESDENLSQHNKELHGVEENGSLFKCFGCEKRFKSRKTRICHEINFCKGLKDGYKCTICDRFLPKRSMYEVHMKDHRHNTNVELPEEIFKCRKCYKLFKTKECLNKHMEEHENTKKNFVCDACGRVFTRQDYLYKHMLTHAGIRRYNCPHCDFRATQRSSLTVHIRKHTGERPYSCDMCPQRCISSSNLRAHRRRHLGLKKYECSICNKKFGYKISLEEHVSSTHERTETHPCEHCGATYTRIRGLRRHLAAKHGKQKEISEVAQQTFLVEVNNEANTHVDKDGNLLKNVSYELKEGDLLLIKDQNCEVFMV